MADNSTHIATLISRFEADVTDGYNALRSQDDTLVAKAKSVLSLTATTEPQWIGAAIELGNVLNNMHGRFGGSPEAIDYAINLSRSTVSRIDDSDERLPDVLDALACALFNRYSYRVIWDDLGEIVELHRRALDMRSLRGIDCWPSLFGLCRSLRFHSVYSDAPNILGLQDSVDYGRRAFETTGYSDERGLMALSDWLHSVVWTFQLRSDSGLLAVDNSITLSAQYLISSPNNSPHWARLLSRVAMAVRVRSELATHSEDDLRNSVTFADHASRQLAAAMNTDTAFAYCNLAVACSLLADKGGGTQYLDEAVEAARQSVDVLPVDSAERAGCYNILGNSHIFRFRRLGDLGNLENSISAYRTGIASVRELPNKISMLGNLANALGDIWRQCGRMEDIHEMVDVSRQATELCPQSDRSYPIEVVTHATSLIERFEVLHDAADLSECIRRLQEVLADCPNYALAVLTRALFLSYKTYGNTADLERAISFGRQWLAILKPSDRAEWPRAISVITAQLCTLVETHPDRAAEILPEVLSMLDAEMTQLQPGDVCYPGLQCTLGFALFLRFTASGDVTDRQQSMDHFALSISHESFGGAERMKFARQWISCAEATGEPHLIIQAYQGAVQLLSSIAYLGMDSRSRLLALRTAPQLVNDGAARAIEFSRPDIALELLEQGRSVFWSSALQLRTSFQALPSVLGEDLRRVSRELEDDSRQSTGASDDNIVRRRMLSIQFQDLLRRVRELPGFNNFLLPPRFAQLRSVANHGPVVLLGAKGEALWAIILRPQCDAAETISLSSLSSDSLAALTQTFTGLHRNAEAASREGNGMERLQIKKQPSKTGRYSWYTLLSELWMKIVRPIVIYLSLKKAYGKDRTRLWFCPTGPFLALPLHAAGNYSTPHSECLSDFAVPSYTPTLGALLTSRDTLEKDTHVDAVRTLLLAQPDVPGQGLLPHASEEVVAIQRALPNGALIPLHAQQLDVELSEQGRGITGEVLSALPSASILHLACHASQDTIDPLKSSFFLSDGQITVAELMRVRTPLARFAFLSACHSAAVASGDDEVVHLAATMLFVGFKSVIGTLWSMNDADGPAVAKNVYEGLISDGRVDMETIPYALDNAVSALRNSGVHPSRWATYVHLGV